MRITASALVCAGALAIPASAHADKIIEAQTVWHFDASTYTLDPGEKLVFKNDDSGSPGPHNVTADAKGPDGKPLFASQTIKNGEQSVVTGADTLKPGSYSFMCTVHPFMMATLVVPGGASGATPPAQSAPAKHGPRVRSSLRGVSFRAHRIVARIVSRASVSVEATLTAKIGAHTITLGHATGSGKDLSLTIRLTRKGRRALAGARRAALTLYVEARAADGSLTTTRTHRLLRR